jgi:hypothetical protein
LFQGFDHSGLIGRFPQMTTGAQRVHERVGLANGACPRQAFWAIKEMFFPECGLFLAEVTHREILQNVFGNAFGTEHLEHALSATVELIGQTVRESTRITPHRYAPRPPILTPNL